MNFKYIFLFCFTFINTVPEYDKYPRKPDEIHPEEPYCNMEMLAYFQFIGLEKPKKMDLSMCQFITNSCCTVSD